MTEFNFDQTENTQVYNIYSTNDPFAIHEISERFVEKNISKIKFQNKNIEKKRKEEKRKEKERKGKKRKEKERKEKKRKGQTFGIRTEP